MNAATTLPPIDVPALRIHDADVSASPQFAARIESESLTYLLISPHGVLYDDTLWWRQLMQMLSHFGLHTNSQMIAALWQQDYYADVCAGRRELFSALREFLLACGLRAGQVDEAIAAGRMHWRRFVRELRAFPQTPMALARLRHAGWRMGLVVDSALTAEESNAQLQRMGIRDCFEHIFYSRDEDLNSQGTRFWTDVPHRLEVTPSSVAFVACDPRSLQAAKSAGLATLGVQRPCECVDVQLDSIEGLFKLRVCRTSMAA